MLQQLSDLACYIRQLVLSLGATTSQFGNVYIPSTKTEQRYLCLYRQMHQQEEKPVF
jgi:hypothetical protein